MVALDVSVIGRLHRQHNDLVALGQALQILRDAPGVRRRRRNDVEAAQKQSRQVAHGERHVGTLTGNPVNEKCAGVDDLGQRTLRELLTLARERLGAAASGLKTKDELVAALTLQLRPLTPSEAEGPDLGSVVTRDFFRRRT